MANAHTIQYPGRPVRNVPFKTVYYEMCKFVSLVFVGNWRKIQVEQDGISVSVLQLGQEYSSGDGTQTFMCEIIKLTEHQTMLQIDSRH